MWICLANPATSHLNLMRQAARTPTTTVNKKSLNRIEVVDQLSPLKTSLDRPHSSHQEPHTPAYVLTLVNTKINIKLSAALLSLSKTPAFFLNILPTQSEIVNTNSTKTPPTPPMNNKEPLCGPYNEPAHTLFKKYMSNIELQSMAGCLHAFNKHTTLKAPHSAAKPTMLTSWSTKGRTESNCSWPS